MQNRNLIFITTLIIKKTNPSKLVLVEKQMEKKCNGNGVQLNIQHVRCTWYLFDEQLAQLHSTIVYQFFEKVCLTYHWNFRV